MLIIALGAAHTLSHISVSFSLFLQMLTQMAGERIICPRSHGQGLTLSLPSSLSDYKVGAHSAGALLRESDLSGQTRCATLSSSGEKGALSAGRQLVSGTHHVVPQCDGHLGVATFREVETVFREEGQVGSSSL